jgi:hypothetical protein
MTNVIAFKPKDEIFLTPSIRRQANRLLCRVNSINWLASEAIELSANIYIHNHFESWTLALELIEDNYEYLCEKILECEVFTIYFWFVKLPSISICLMRRGACFRLYWYYILNMNEPKKIAA